MALAIEIIRISLKVFYRFIYQDIHPKIEDNLSSWSAVMKQLLEPGFGAELGRSEILFKTRGEATKVCMFVLSKYKEDFQQHIMSFIENVWQNCIRYAGGEDEETFINSIRFFRTFASNQEYFKFFEANLEDICVKLIIPGLRASEDDQTLYSEDPKNFSELIFAAPYPSAKKRYAISELVGTLAKFNRSSLLLAMQKIHLELTKQRSISTLPLELAFLDMVCLSVVLANNPEEGAVQLIVNSQFVLDVWESLCENFWINILQNKNLPTGNELEAIKFSLCLQVHYAALFKYCLNIPKLLNMSLMMLGALKDRKSLRNCLLKLIIKLLKSKKFTTTNNLDVDDQALSFFQKHYNNPKKFIFTLQHDSTLLDLASNTDLVASLTALLTMDCSAGSFDAISANLLQLITKATEKHGQVPRELIEIVNHFLLSLVTNPNQPHSDMLQPMFEAAACLCSSKHNA